jgi:hypothetical protein
MIFMRSFFSLKFLIFIFALNGQINAEENLKRHEIKLDAFSAMFSWFQMEYEYSLNNRTALSLTAFHSFTTKPDIQNRSFASYKLYFFKHGNFPWLFMESNLGYARGYNSFCTGERGDHGECHASEEYYKSYNAFLVGFSGGIKKFFSETDTGLEIVLGGGSLYGGTYGWYNFSINFVRRF